MDTKQSGTGHIHVQYINLNRREGSTAVGTHVAINQSILCRLWAIALLHTGIDLGLCVFVWRCVCVGGGDVC